MTTFYDDINDFFENDENVKNNINEPIINILHSKIIKDYKEGTDDFEDKVMSHFQPHFQSFESHLGIYDDICNHIIFIYYNSDTELDDYYNGIYKKKKFSL